jgi:preprotein translocase subunit SecA
VCVREDRNDSIFLSTKEKYQAVIDEVKQIHGEGRPILVGTVAVETSEHVAGLLKKERIPHSVLNAKYHEQEAEIVARAGQRGTVTIATNMAGRGTDIKLAEGIPGIGGLHVLGTERHESRRIDRQLRGRCARQGDPGSSHFFLSLEDDLMRLYGASDKMGGWLEKLGMEEGEEISHPMLNRSIETAQKRVEQHHYQTRRRTLEYDDVMNKQREELYGFRNRVLHGDDTRDIIFDIIEEVTIERVEGHLSQIDDTEDTDGGLRPLDEWVNLTYPVGLDQAELEKAYRNGTEEPSVGSIYDGLTAGQFAVCRRIIDAVHSVYEIKIAAEEAGSLAQGERYTVLTAVDRLWRDHLYAMDGLRQSVHLRAYGQKDPLVEYKTEARDMFEELMVHIKEEVCKNVFLTASSLESVQHFLRSLPTQASHQMASAFGLDTSMINASSDVVSEVNSEVSAEQKARPVRSGPRVGRNDPCPCGSGKKYKKCCG